MMKKSILGMMAFGLVLAIGDYQPGGAVEGWSFVREAHAIVGRPLTPVSVAGVARRTTRRAIYATSIYVATLPPACTVVVIEGTTLQQCGGTYYRPSGNQFVVVNVQ
jgi:hypothetical protein